MATDARPRATVRPKSKKKRSRLTPHRHKLPDRPARVTWASDAHGNSGLFDLAGHRRFRPFLLGGVDRMCDPFLTSRHASRGAPFACESLERRRMLSAGDLDLTFGDGTVTVDLPGSNSDTGLAVALQADGRLVVAALSDGDFAVTRYAPDGTIDAGFGAGGTARVEFGKLDIPRDIAVDGEGRIVVAGYSAMSPTRSGGDFAVARLTPAGQPDLAFDGDGRTTVDFGARDAAYGLALRPDNRIVLAGHTQPEQNNSIGHFAIAALRADGSPDPTFDGDGRYTIAINNVNAAASDVVIDAQGRLVIGGTTGNTTGALAVARLLADGAHDGTFGGGGLIVTPMVGVLRSLALAPDGKIVAGGQSGGFGGGVGDVLAVRYNPDGSLDSSFDGDGKAVVDVGPFSSDRGNAVAVGPDGSVFIAGTTDSGGLHTILVRLTPGGAPDTTFGGDGVVTGGPMEFHALALAPGGAAVAAGVTPDRGPFGSVDVLLARYIAAGSPDPSFGGGDGLVTTDIIGPAFNRARAVAVQADGKVLLGGEVESGNDRVTDFGIARLNADGTPDSSFGWGDGQVVNDFGNHQDWLGALAVLPDGRIVAAGYGHGLSFGNQDVIVARYLPDGRTDPSFGEGTGRVFVSDVDGLGDGNEFGVAMAIQPDGKIVVAGGHLAQDNGVLVVRLEPSGARDATFGGGDGAVLTPVQGAGNYVFARAVAVDPAGRIVVTGGQTAAAVLCYAPDGRLNPDFGPGGIVVVSFDPTAGATGLSSAVAVDPAGRVVVAGETRRGTAPSDFGLARLRADGSLDPDFGDGGRMITDFAGSDDRAAGLVLQPDGAIVAGGTSSSGPTVPPTLRTIDFALARYTPSGALDPSFGGDGRVTTDFGGLLDTAHGVALDPEGRVVLGGESGADFAAARYEAFAPPPPRVTSVAVAGAAWSDAFRRHLRDTGLAVDDRGFVALADADPRAPLPWVNLDRVSVTFSRNVRVDDADLGVTGARVPEYVLDQALFTYDAASRTATWALPAGTVLGADKILLDVDGGPDGVASGDTPLDGDNDGTPGGDFRLRIDILPGDADLSGSVLANDFSDVKRKFFSTTTNPGTGPAAYSAFHDVDGSGAILANDFSEVKRRFFNTLPPGEPGVAVRAKPLRRRPAAELLDRGD